MIEDDLPPSCHDWMIFRPDSLARDAMMRFSIAFPHVIKQLDDYLTHTEQCFEAWREEQDKDEKEELCYNFALAVSQLQERIALAAEVIHANTAKQAPASVPPGQTIGDTATGWDPATEARNKWIYGECMKGVAFASIIARLRNKPKKWGRISTVGGIKNAANTYATRHNLSQIPTRQPGRRPSENM
jgi:hypothetical protein